VRITWRSRACWYQGSIRYFLPLTAGALHCIWVLDIYFSKLQVFFLRLPEDKKKRSGLSVAWEPSWQLPPPMKPGFIGEKAVLLALEISKPSVVKVRTTESKNRHVRRGCAENRSAETNAAFALFFSESHCLSQSLEKLSSRAPPTRLQTPSVTIRCKLWTRLHPPARSGNVRRLQADGCVGWVPRRIVDGRKYRWSMIGAKLAN